MQRQSGTPTDNVMPETDDPAPDVNDLATAKRYIAGLRSLLTRAAEEAELLENEIAVFLSPEDAQKAEWLFERRKLCYAQCDDSDLEFFDAFQEFVSDWLDVAYDMATHEGSAAGPAPLRPNMA